VPASWWRHRLVGSFRVAPGRWLDLRALGTFQILRTAFAELAASLGLADVDLSVVAGQLPIAGPERRLTQAISRWAFEQGFGGVVYTSRLHQRYQCWAVFEGTRLQPVGPPEPITPDDPDFVLTARRLGLLIEP